MERYESTQRAPAAAANAVTPGPEAKNAARNARRPCADDPRNSIVAFMHSSLRGIWKALSAERRCFACGSIFRPAGDAGCGTPFCPTCAALSARRESGFCPLCGALYAWPHLPVVACAACLREKPPWNRLLFHGEHEGLLRRLLLDLKFRGQTHLGSALGALLSAHPVLRELPADVLTPVPLHRTRLLHRGYNQALELARPAAAALGRPLRPDLLRRIRATAPQTRSDRSERAANVAGAFACERAVRGRHIVLVDDTLTTGATLRSATAALLDAGAAGVCVAVLSRVRRLSGQDDTAFTKELPIKPCFNQHPAPSAGRHRPGG
ncbi:MAG: ComF family protein [Desulfovibrio sp.]|jgi:ComF family protein|nr:ComF family protein [Desulfovibrio sp.]